MYSNKAVANSERGSFFVEFAIAFPIMLFLFVGTIDLSVGMLNYLRVSRIAYEAARYGASLSNMVGAYDSTKPPCAQDAYSFVSLTDPLGKVKRRAQDIVDKSPLYFTEKNLIDYRVSYDPAQRQVHVCMLVP